MQRKMYLNMQTREEAQRVFWSRFASYTLGTETITSRDAFERVSAAPIFARFSAPSFHSAAMDGLAVQAEETFGASDESPKTLNVESGQAQLINTGFPLPEDKNAVIMIENVLLSSDGKEGIIRAPVYPWQHVRKVGEDIVATELLFTTGHRFRAPDIGALLAAGIPTVEVRKKPQVRIIPTGNELVNLGDYPDTIPSGKTVESNSGVLNGLVKKAGGVAQISPILKDDYEGIKAHLLEMVNSDADMVIINAGSSAGSADYTVRIVEELGEVLVHGVTIMPGKPTILAVINNKPVVGLPGYPVSAIIAMEQLVMPLLAQIQGIYLEPPVMIKATLAKDLPSRAGIEEFRRMIVGRIGVGFVAVPLKQGSGTITTLTRANSILRIDAASEGEKAGQLMEIDLLHPLPQIERTILSTGSHDLCLDLLNDLLRQRKPSFTLASTHVGSLGGIMALKQGMCHMAGSHLLDPKDGSYNTSYVQKHLADKDIRVVTLVHREQGFMVRPGNPKGIKTIHDLFNKDVQFINRQAGSGTRVLLDYELDRQGLDPDDILGYENDEYTHMAVAVAVLANKVDVGLGIKSAAKALGLDFVPLLEERYDLLIPGQFFESPMIQAALEVITSRRFQERVEALGGYSTRETGKLVSSL
nr:molybdopterin biosynthesis protein [uncultured Desulfobulbus sp.]